MKYTLFITAALVACPALAADGAKDAIRVIPHNVDPGSRLELDRSAIIEGDVGDYAVIHVSNGGLRIKGNVGEGAVIQTSGASVEINQESEHGGSHVEVHASGTGNSIIVNGEQVNAPDSLSGIDIKGDVGEGAQLGTDSSIIARDVGAKARLNAGNSIQVKHIQHDAALQAGNGITGTEVGPHAQLTAGNSVEVDTIGAGAHVEAHNSVTAQTINEGAYVKAGNSITAETTHSKDLHAGNSINIR